MKAVYVLYVAYLISCSASLKTYAHDDTSIGSWMMGVRATYKDDNHLCCSGINQGNLLPRYNH